MDRCGGEWRQTHRRAVSEDATKVVSSAATATVTATEVETIMGGGWEDYPSTRGLGQDRG